MENLEPLQKQMLTVIENIPIFVGIGEEQQHLLLTKARTVNFDAEEVIIEQGEEGDSLYAVMSGHVEVLKKIPNGSWASVASLGPGSVFGEISILRRIPRTARVVTKVPCKFLTINSQDFFDAYLHFPARARDNIQIFMAKRLEELRWAT